MSMEEFVDFVEEDFDCMDRVKKEPLTYEEDLEFENRINSGELEMMEDQKFEEFFTNTLQEKDFK